MTEAPNISIRPATPTDLRAIGRLGALLVRVHHDFDPARFLAPTSGTERGYASFLGAQLDEPDAVILVAVREGEVIGYTYAAVEGLDYASLRGKAGVLHDILVDPAHRGYGAGRKLLEATISALHALGASQFVLFTAAQNERAQRMFVRAGFRTTMVEMTLDLKAAGVEPRSTNAQER